MDRLRRSFRDSFRRRKDRVPESSKPHQWQSDAEAVRSATCSFPVKYLGCVEVFESRGMHICEEALKVLRVISYSNSIFIRLSNKSRRLTLFHFSFFRLNRIPGDVQFVAFCM